MECEGSIKEPPKYEEPLEKPEDQNVEENLKNTPLYEDFKFLKIKEKLENVCEPSPESKEPLLTSVSTVIQALEASNDQVESARLKTSVGDMEDCGDQNQNKCQESEKVFHEKPQDKPHDSNFCLSDSEISGDSIEKTKIENEIPRETKEQENENSFQQELQQDFDDRKDCIFTRPEDADVALKESEMMEIPDTAKPINKPNPNCCDNVNGISESKSPTKKISKEADSELIQEIIPMGKDEDFYRMQRKKLARAAWRTIFSGQCVDNQQFTKNSELFLSGAEIFPGKALTPTVEFLSPRVLKRLADIFGNTYD